MADVTEKAYEAAVRKVLTKADAEALEKQAAEARAAEAPSHHGKAHKKSAKKGKKHGRGRIGPAFGSPAWRAKYGVGKH